MRHCAAYCYSMHGLSVCLSLCWSRPRVLPKRINRSRAQTHVAPRNHVVIKKVKVARPYSRMCAWQPHRLFLFHFYRAMLCYAMLAMTLCLSVCQSVTSRCSTKTAKRRITQITPHDSPVTLVSWRQRSPRNSTALRGRQIRWGGSKSATFGK